MNEPHASEAAPSEHPFAQYVRILGKGPRLSRALTIDEARTAAAMVFRDEVEPVQLGAFLCLLRVRTETPEEVAGFALAIRDSLQRPADLPPVDVDWPSYAGKARRLPLFILAALLLAGSGVRIFMHGTEGHTAGRLYTRETLAALGVPAASSPAEAAGQLAAYNFTYAPMELLNPKLNEIFGLKSLLGLRSPLHTVVRNVNPFDARAALISVFHPNYRAVHRDAAKLMGMHSVACFKGDGGEVERRPDKPCLVDGLLAGTEFSEEWAPLLSGGPESPNGMDPAFLGALWRGTVADSFAEATIVGTAAVALRQLGRAKTVDEAERLARQLWGERRRDRLVA